MNSPWLIFLAAAIDEYVLVAPQRAYSTSVTKSPKLLLVSGRILPSDVVPDVPMPCATTYVAITPLGGSGRFSMKSMTIPHAETLQRPAKNRIHSSGPSVPTLSYDSASRAADALGPASSSMKLETISTSVPIISLFVNDCMSSMVITIMFHISIVA